MVYNYYAVYSISVVDGRDNDKWQCEIHSVEFKSKTEARASGTVKDNGQVQPVDRQS